MQRGGTHRLVTAKPLVLYEGNSFPFQDQQFDYAICSHVLEHVEDVEAFCSEVFRVAKRGYFEFPTIHYEYLYNFSVHQQLLKFESGELLYLSKQESGLPAFASVQQVFYRSLELGYTGIIDDLFPMMFQGFEWDRPFKIRKAGSVLELALDPALVQPPKRVQLLIRRGLRRILGNSR